MFTKVALLQIFAAAGRDQLLLSHCQKHIPYKKTQMATEAHGKIRNYKIRKIFLCGSVCFRGYSQ